MSQLFLTSSVNYVAHDIAKKLDLSQKNKLVFITTPVEPDTGDTSWMNDDRQSLVEAGFYVTDYSITNKAADQLKQDLKDFDYIYMSGGNTLYLLRQSQKSGFIPLIKELVNNQGKIYIGTSAGSIIAGKKCPDYLLDQNEVAEMENVDGYGFVNFTIMPHWGSEHFREKYLGGRLEAANKFPQVPFILLTDNQYVHVKGDSYQIFDVTV
jgi:dipeptidase E